MLTGYDRLLLGAGPAVHRVPPAGRARAGRATGAERGAAVASRPLRAAGGAGQQTCGENLTKV